MKKLRLARGFTQEQMAVWMYMDQSTYCRLERGKRKVNAEELERFCSLVGITVDAYMNGDLHPRLPNGDTFKGATQAGEQVGSDGFLRDMLDRKDRQIEETQGLMRSMLELLRATLEQRRKRNSPGGGA